MYFVSNALAREIEKIAIASWKKVNLSPSHAYLLILVLEEPGMQPMALSEELHLQPSTITRLVEKLEEKKLLVRTTQGKMTNVFRCSCWCEQIPSMNTAIIWTFSKVKTPKSACCFFWNAIIRIFVNTPVF